MSFLVLHMDKFKKEAVRGIQSHNKRERESHSNPDIDYERSAGNYDLHESASLDYAVAVQNRIDDLLLVKAVRHDAVHLCGLIVSSDSEFFKNLSPEESKHFFEESKAFLTEFVGSENVISAVHMDEKTPHMHFLHVPVTEDGRLNANKIYTRESLKKLQTEMPEYLQSKGFNLQRGVEQVPGAAKKHLNTREFKQQQNALDLLQQQVEAVYIDLEQGLQEESKMQERVQSYERQAQEAEKILGEDTALPDASMFNYKTTLEKAQRIIEQQKKALASKHLLAAHNEKQQQEIESLKKTVNGLNEKIIHMEASHTEEQKRSNQSTIKWMDAYSNVSARLEQIDNFFRWDLDANKMFNDYRQERQHEAERKAVEQKQWETKERKKQLKKERERQGKEHEKQAVQEAERQKQELEARREQQRERNRCGIGR